MDKKRKIIEFGELEGDRRSTGNSPNSSSSKVIPDPEVSTKKSRRRFTKEYKIAILNEIDSSIKRGATGTILRREGLYYSNIVKWREQLELGKLRKTLSNKDQKKITELSKQNRKLQRELNRSRLIIDAQKKILEILEMEDQS